MSYRLAPLLVLSVALILIVGCEKKFTRDNWEMIKIGAYEKVDVEDTLGKPQTKPFDDLWWYHEGSREAKIYFEADGTVKAKKWLNAKTGETAVVPEGWIEK